MGDSPGKRLALFRKSLGINQRTFAAALGVSPGRIGSMETDVDPPSRRFLQTISERYNVSADWLLNGHGEQFHAPVPGFQGRSKRVEPPDYARAGHGDVRFGDNDYVFIRRADISVSAGNGTADVEGPDTGSVALPTSWCSRAGINSDLAILVKVAGDSMSPTIADGSFVLIHLIEKNVLLPGIYAFTRDGEAFIKRLIPSEMNADGRPGTIMVMSDNPAFAPCAVSGPRLNDLRIVGRVRAVFATL
jgi:phage repressor protein C with HTH and peptisase S24 domain